MMHHINPYEVHKRLINHYIVSRSGDLAALEKHTSTFKTDYDVLKQNHRFLWDKDAVTSWEDQLAKKYYDKLFKEYCIGDLSRYKENKIALRWRVEREVIEGKGQFICGNKKCKEENELRTWEVNFAYQENNEKKNALIKIRLCPDCSKKLNYHSQKREIKRSKRKSQRKEKKFKESILSSGKRSKNVVQETSEEKTTSVEDDQTETACSSWEQQKPVEVKSREDEMEEYLQELLL